MAFETDKYIIDLIRQLNLNNMDDARRARLKDLKDNKIATKEQQSWIPDKPLPDIDSVTPGANPGDPATYTYTGEEVGAPNVIKPSADDLKDLYNKFQSMLYSVSEDADLMKNKAVSGFVNQFYGTNKAVYNLAYADNLPDPAALGDYIQNNLADLVMSLGMTDQEGDLKKLATALLETPPKHTTKTKHIKTLQSFLVNLYNVDTEKQKLPAGLPSFLQIPSPLTDIEGKDLATSIKSNLAALENATGISTADLSNLATNLTNGQYTQDPFVYNILTQLVDAVYNGAPIRQLVPSIYNQDTIEKILNFKPGKINLDKSNISQLHSKVTETVPPTPAQLIAFGRELSSMLGKMVSDDKLREKLLSKAPHDLSSWFNDGFDKSNYKSGDNALAPKYKDRKTFWDNAKSEVKKFYNDTLGKLSQKHTRHIYQTDARYIVAGLIGKGVKPTDGTAKILNTLDAIMGDLPNPVQGKAKKIKNLFSKLSKTDFFAQALHDGDQMRQLVQEIAKAAARGEDGFDMESAEIALEMLAVMRYTLTTSSIRDKLQKAEVKIFSDPGLSFNKGVFGDITKAVDKTIKWGMMAAFEVGNLAKNAINEHGVKFGHGTDRVDKRTTDSNDYKNDPDKRAKMEYLFGFWDNVNTSANTKDYWAFRKHSQMQKNADNDAGAPITNPITLETIAKPTMQQKQTMEWIAQNNIGRV